jgi:uncharacterized protein
LKQVGEAEAFIRSLVRVKQLRVRLHGSLARIEVGRDERHFFFDAELMDKIWSRLQELGFSNATLDLYGYRSGSMNASG